MARNPRVGTYFMYVRNRGTCHQQPCGQAPRPPDVAVPYRETTHLASCRRTSPHPNGFSIAKRFFLSCKLSFFPSVGWHAVRLEVVARPMGTCSHKDVTASPTWGIARSRHGLVFIFFLFSPVRMANKIPFIGLRPWIHPVF